MIVAESILLCGATVLTILIYVNYTRQRRLMKRIQAEYKQANQLNKQARQRCREAIALRTEALQARDKAVKEAERIVSFWNAKHWN